MKRRRKELNLSLGEMANRVKCSDSHLSDIEHNKRRPTPAMIRRLCKALTLDYEYVCLSFGRVPERIRNAVIREDFSPLHELEQRLLQSKVGLTP